MLDDDGIVDLESVRCLLAAARHPSFSSAARSVHLSAAAFGQRIARLEDELGTTLFHRTTRRKALTDAGARAVAAGRRLMEAQSEFRQSTDANARPLPFSLTVGTRFELGLSWITPGLTALAQLCPQRRLHLSFGNSADLVSRVLNESIDAGVTSSHVLPDELEFEVLLAETYVLVEATGASPAALGPELVRDKTLLDLDASLPLFSYLLRAQDSSVPWQFARVEHLGTIAAIRLRALEGVGIAVLPRYFIEHDLETGALVELKHGGTMKSDTFRLVWRKDHRQKQHLLQLAADLRSIPFR